MKHTRLVHLIISSLWRTINKCRSIRSSRLMIQSVCSLIKLNPNILRKIISKMILIVVTHLLIKMNNWQKLNSLLNKSCYCSLRLLILREIVLSTPQAKCCDHKHQEVDPPINNWNLYKNPLQFKSLMSQHNFKKS